MDDDVHHRVGSERSITFYCETLGFTVARKLSVDVELGTEMARIFEVQSAKIHFGFLKRCDLRMQLVQFEKPETLPSPGRKPSNRVGINLLC